MLNVFCAFTTNFCWAIIWVQFTLNRNVNATLLFLLPFFMSWTQRFSDIFSVHKRTIPLKYCSQRVPPPTNIQQLHTAIEEEWTNIPQATINNLINSMWRKCEANGGLTSPNKAELHISEWPFIVASLRHTCATFMLSNQHLDMLHLLGGMDYLCKGEVLTNRDLHRFVNNIWEKWFFCVYRKCFRSLSSAHEKWEQKQKCCIYIFVQCIKGSLLNITG